MCLIISRNLTERDEAFNNMGTGLNEKTCEILRKPLASFTRRGPGGTYSYHKGSDVIRRLNEAFGHCWSSEKLDVEVIEEQVLMLVSLTVYTDSDTITHHGYGSADVKRGNANSKIVSIGNDYKSAFTNALKRAAEQFGIGLGDEEEETVSTKPSYQTPTVTQSVPRQPDSLVGQPAMLPTGAPTRPPMTRPEPMAARPQQAHPNGMGGDIRAVATAAMNNAVAPVSVPAAPPINPPHMVKPEVKDGLINSVQKQALQHLANTKGVTEEILVMGALPESGKVSFEELLRSEATEVIRHANVLPQGRPNG